jgi:hypothetical protein
LASGELSPGAFSCPNQKENTMPVRYDEHMLLRCQSELKSALRKAAEQNGTKEGEFVRHLIISGMRARDIDLKADFDLPRRVELCRTHS